MVLLFALLIVASSFSSLFVEAKIYNTVTETEINHEEESQESFEYQGEPGGLHKLSKLLGVSFFIKTSMY